VKGRVPASGIPPGPTDEFWERLSAIEAEVIAPARPLGSFTTQEYAERQKISRSAAGERLNRLRKAGKVELCGRGNDWYWIIK
jgi:predicted HTH transcriptional regulator